MSEREQATVDFRDGDTVFVKGVKRPTFMYDLHGGVRLKYGEYEHVLAYYEEVKERYQQAGIAHHAESIYMVELDADQALIDQLFQSSGAFATYIQNLHSQVIQ